MIDLQWEALLIICSILLNLIVILLFFKVKLEKTQIKEDVDDLYQSIELFISNLEKENDTLYQKLVQYNKVKENRMNERIHQLERKLQSNAQSETVIEQPIVEQKEETSHSHNYQIEKATDDKNEKIIKLSKQGFTSKQIAKLLQMEIGIIELLINMERKKANQK